MKLLKSGTHDADFYAQMWDGIQRQGSWQGEIWNRRKNGKEFPEWLTITAVKNAGGAVTHYVLDAGYHRAQDGRGPSAPSGPPRSVD
ncbi:hypothetical protein [Methylomonas koyamae]|uniref:hypothetical protein n=1 Tax=Methylomonas koyamae TaxID=702114 RepID=UPI0012F684FD